MSHDAPTPALADRCASVARGAAQCWAGVIEDESSLRASSLAYSVLFCAAPIFGMILGFSGMFPKAFLFLPRLYEEIGPRVLPSALGQVASSLRGYADNAANVSVASLVLFVVSALFLSMQLERCIQQSWGIRQDPKLAGNPLARHWLALTLTPCAMGLLGWAAYEALALAPGAGTSWLASLGLLFGFFAIATWALPAARPPFWVAAAASALASVECLAIQSGFGYAWSMSQSYGVIYGAAAVFLGALLWIWLFWLSLLTSVSVCSTLFLNRPRDLASNGLGLVDQCLSFFEAGRAARLGLPAASPAPLLLAMPAEVEMRLLDRLGSDPDLCDPMTYLAAMAQAPSPTLHARRSALGEACAARAATRAIELATHPLANPDLGDRIQMPTHTTPNDAPHEPRT